MDIGFSTFDPSLALDAILHCDEHEIVTRTPALPPYLALESMAQTCGMHLRHRHDFRIKAYLVAIDDLLHVPGQSPPLVIRAAITAETTAGASYAVTVNDAHACRILIGRQASDMPDTFFRSRFACLSKASCNA